MSEYVRPIQSRYRDPLDLVWLATARRLGLHVRRNPAIFSATDGSGLLELGPQYTLDPDDTTAQMVLHELCHWITNGLETFGQRDWGFALDSELDWREHACLRLQAELTGRWGLRNVLAPTSQFRQYYDGIPEDVCQTVEGWPHEAEVVALTRVALARAAGEPWVEAMTEAFRATAAIRGAITPFLGDYATDVHDDPLPSLWARS